jgi:2-dehydropantoate 2-reductase
MMAVGGALVRVLVLGAGVIGSVYAGRLLRAGHDVLFLARGLRLVDLQTYGLVLEDAESGDRLAVPVPSVADLAASDRFDLVLVPVRAEQLRSTLPVLTAMTDDSDVLFFGNASNKQRELTAALGGRALFGFPAAGGLRDGPVVRFVPISQQKTMLGEPDGSTSPRVRHLQGVLEEAGFPTLISSDIEGWLVGHTAFVVPMAFALYRVGGVPAALAADAATMRLMVSATREAFTALGAYGNAEIPSNLRTLYRLPTRLVIGYWRRVLTSPRGELWFGAHSRAAPREMHELADELRAAVRHTGRPTPDLERLLG